MIVLQAEPQERTDQDVEVTLNVSSWVDPVLDLLRDSARWVTRSLTTREPAPWNREARSSTLEESSSGDTEAPSSEDPASPTSSLPAGPLAIGTNYAGYPQIDPGG